MNLVYTFDPEKFYLDPPCQRGHLWPGTSCSLRRKNHRAPKCVACESREKNWLVRFIDQKVIKLSPKTKLGKLCKNKHRYSGLEASLRRSDNYMCIECKKETDRSLEKRQQVKQWYEQNKQKQKEKARLRMQKLRENPEWREIQRERVRHCNAKRRASVGRVTRAKGLEGLLIPPGYSLTLSQARIAKILVAQGLPLSWDILYPKITEQLENEATEKAAKKAEAFAKSRKGRMQAFLLDGGTIEEFEENEAYEKKIEQRAKHHILYEQSEEYRLYHRQKSKLRKAITKENTAINATGKQILDRFAEFNHRCAYCGDKGNLHIEHVVPISRGGPHAIGNIIPACSDCNLKKRDSDALDWYREQSFYSEARWKKICAILGWHKSSIGQLAML